MRYRQIGGLLGVVVLAVTGCRPSVKQPAATNTPAASVVSPSPVAVASPSPRPVLSPTPIAVRSAWVAPAVGRSVIRVPKQVADPPTDFLRVPKGWKVQLVAGGLIHPRWLTVAPNGDMFVVESRTEMRTKIQANQVTVLRDADGDGVAEQRSLWADGLYLPFGIAIHKDYLYVANTGSVVRWPYATGQMTASGAPEVVVKDIPELGMRQHWTRNILFSDDPACLYITIGSKENADIEEELRGTIVSVPLDASGKPDGAMKIVASGMRNPTGLAIHPITGKLWAVVNERDYLGDDLVPDFLTEVKEGGFYGWPYYYLGQHHDPRLPERSDLKAKVIMPDVLLGAHAAPLGLVFTPDGRTALIARHGSQNRSVKIGYDVVRVRFDAAGHPIGGYEPIITGWLIDPHASAVNGRPVGLAFAKDGSLLIADDWGGRIWRIPPGREGY